MPHQSLANLTDKVVINSSIEIGGNNINGKLYKRYPYNHHLSLIFLALISICSISTSSNKVVVDATTSSQNNSSQFSGTSIKSLPSSTLTSSSSITQSNNNNNQKSDNNNVYETNNRLVSAQKLIVELKNNNKIQKKRRFQHDNKPNEDQPNGEQADASNDSLDQLMDGRLNGSDDGASKKAPAETIETGNNWPLNELSNNGSSTNRLITANQIHRPNWFNIALLPNSASHQHQHSPMISSINQQIHGIPSAQLQIQTQPVVDGGGALFGATHQHQSHQHSVHHQPVIAGSSLPLVAQQQQQQQPMPPAMLGSVSGPNMQPVYRSNYLNNGPHQHHQSSPSSYNQDQHQSQHIHQSHRQQQSNKYLSHQHPILAQTSASDQLAPSSVPSTVNHHLNQHQHQHQHQHQSHRHPLDGGPNTSGVGDQQHLYRNNYHQYTTNVKQPMYQTSSMSSEEDANIIGRGDNGSGGGGGGGSLIESGHQYHQDSHQSYSDYPTNQQQLMTSKNYARPTPQTSDQHQHHSSGQQSPPEAADLFYQGVGDPLGTPEVGHHNPQRMLAGGPIGINLDPSITMNGGGLTMPRMHRFSPGQPDHLSAAGMMARPARTRQGKGRRKANKGKLGHKKKVIDQITESNSDDNSDNSDDSDSDDDTSSDDDSDSSSASDNNNNNNNNNNNSTGGGGDEKLSARMDELNKLVSELQKFNQLHGQNKRENKNNELNEQIKLKQQQMANKQREAAAAREIIDLIAAKTAAKVAERSKMQSSSQQHPLNQLAGHIMNGGSGHPNQPLIDHSTTIDALLDKQLNKEKDKEKEAENALDKEDDLGDDDETDMDEDEKKRRRHRKRNNNNSNKKKKRPNRQRGALMASSEVKNKNLKKNGKHHHHHNHRHRANKAKELLALERELDHENDANVTSGQSSPNENQQQTEPQESEYSKMDRARDKKLIRDELIKSRLLSEATKKRMPMSELRALLERAIKRNEVPLQGDGGESFSSGQSETSNSTSVGGGDDPTDSLERHKSESAPLANEYPISEKVSSRLNTLSRDLDSYFNDGFFEEAQDKGQQARNDVNGLASSGSSQGGGAQDGEAVASSSSEVTTDELRPMANEGLINLRRRQQIIVVPGPSLDDEFAQFKGSDINHANHDLYNRDRRESGNKDETNNNDNKTKEEQMTKKNESHDFDLNVDVDGKREEENENVKEIKEDEDEEQDDEQQRKKDKDEEEEKKKQKEMMNNSSKHSNNQPVSSSQFQYNESSGGKLPIRQVLAGDGFKFFGAEIEANDTSNMGNDPVDGESMDTPIGGVKIKGDNKPMSSRQPTEESNLARESTKRMEKRNRIIKGANDELSEFGDELDDAGDTIGSAGTNRSATSVNSEPSVKSKATTATTLSSIIIDGDKQQKQKQSAKSKDNKKGKRKKRKNRRRKKLKKNSSRNKEKETRKKKRKRSKKKQLGEEEIAISELGEDNNNSNNNNNTIVRGVDNYNDGRKMMTKEEDEGKKNKKRNNKGNGNNSKKAKNRTKENSEAIAFNSSLNNSTKWAPIDPSQQVSKRMWSSPLLANLDANSTTSYHIPSSLTTGSGGGGGGGDGDISMRKASDEANKRTNMSNSANSASQKQLVAGQTNLSASNHQSDSRIQFDDDLGDDATIGGHYQLRPITGT